MRVRHATAGATGLDSRSGERYVTVFPKSRMTSCPYEIDTFLYTKQFASRVYPKTRLATRWRLFPKTKTTWKVRVVLPRSRHTVCPYKTDTFFCSSQKRATPCFSTTATTRFRQTRCFPRLRSKPCGMTIPNRYSTTLSRFRTWGSRYGLGAFFTNPASLFADYPPVITHSHGPKD